MRDAFVGALLNSALKDSTIMLMTGDLGFGVLNDYRRAVPDQFANVGVAEQNLAGVGAGMAMTGYKVFTYSIGNFPTLRCLEQIRNDICYHNAKVTIVTIGGGMAYGALGPSHFATEDLAIMRALPGMTVVAPGDPWETESLVPQIVDLEGPAYLRLGRAGEKRILEKDVRVELGQPTPVREGSDVLVFSTGGMLAEVVEAARALERDGISTRVASVHTIRPLAAETILEMAAEYELVITCEEHSVIGGLGGAVAECLAEGGYRGSFRRLGLKPEFATGVGTQEFMREQNGVSAALLSHAVKKALAGDG